MGGPRSAGEFISRPLQKYAFYCKLQNSATKNSGLLAVSSSDTTSSAVRSSRSNFSMRASTCSGICVMPALSKYTSGLPWIFCLRIGKSFFIAYVDKQTRGLTRFLRRPCESPHCFRARSSRSTLDSMPARAATPLIHVPERVHLYLTNFLGFHTD